MIGKKINAFVHKKKIGEIKPRQVHHIIVNLFSTFNCW